MEAQKDDAAQPDEVAKVAEPEYPPETFRWMSWATIRFINRPTWRPLAWVCFGLLALMVGAVASSFFIEISVRVDSSGSVVANPGVLQVVAHSEALMSVPRIALGAKVAKGEVVGLLQMEMEESEIEKMVSALDANTALIERSGRKTGLREGIENGKALSVIHDDAAIRDAATALQSSVRQLRENLEGLGAFEADKGTVIRQSGALRGVLEEYLERHRLRSPTSGTLLQYEVASNARVKSGDTVATILPEGAALVASVVLEAKDVPNVSVGQRIQHKLEAYPFQRYGLFEGEVLSIDRTQEKGELLYRVTASVRTPTTLSPRVAQNVHLVMGMKLNSQIITGERLLFDLLADSLFGKG
jgi:biotin carboxyl carrier protein